MSEPDPSSNEQRRRPHRRVRTPTVLQMEAVECGAAALGMILAYHGRFVPLEVLRSDCGVSRDGSKASSLIKTARRYGLAAKGFRKDPADLVQTKPPFIVFWNFNHFLVVEGFRGNRVYLNDPATGPRTVTFQEFDESFTGVVLIMQPAEGFAVSERPPGMTARLRRRLAGSRLALTYVVLAGLLLVVPGLVVPTFARVFLDDVLIAGSDEWLRPLLLAMVLTAGIRALLSWLQKRFLGRLETKMALSTSSTFLWHVLRLPVHFFHQRSAGDIAARASANERLARLLSGDLAAAALNLLVIVFYMLVMLLYDRLLTGIAVGVAVLDFVAMRAVSRRRVDANQRLLQDRGKLIGTSTGGLQTVETLKATGSEADFFARWAGEHARVVNGEQRLGASTLVLSALPPLLTQLNTIAVLGVGALRVMDGHLSMGQLVAFQSLAASFLWPVGEMVRLGGTLQEVEGDLARVDDVLKHGEDGWFDRGQVVDTGCSERLRGEVELRGVSYGYSRLDPPLISGLDLHIRPGSRVALVGASGSGKSTVGKIIAGLLTPWQGEVLFDGTPRPRISSAVLASSIATVDQDIFLFAGSVRDNLTLWDATIPEAVTIAAARDACIHELVAARSGGYDLELDEGGRNFSGGERQRLEIARALADSPSILILDEATCSLDPLTEQEIDRAIRRRGCTCIMVAHRLCTIRDADEIIVLEQGRVVERGTHESLVRAGGTYAELIRAD